MDILGWRCSKERNAPTSSREHAISQKRKEKKLF
jgi:hypothetical protein